MQPPLGDLVLASSSMLHHLFVHDYSKYLSQVEPPTSRANWKMIPQYMISWLALDWS